ncbi:MAG: hypothetical protein OTJ97_07245, partial [SAR202 cluster bacterium]|nr:hypothetical protein [SAR202 cluster bacterium]
MNPTFSAAWRDRVMKRADDGSPWNTFQAAAGVVRNDAFKLTRAQCGAAYAAYRLSPGVPPKPTTGPDVAADAYIRADEVRFRAWAADDPRLGTREIVEGQLVLVGMDVDEVEDVPDDASMVTARSMGNRFEALSSPRSSERATSSKRAQSTRSVRSSSKVGKARGQQKSRSPTAAKVRPKPASGPDIGDMEQEIADAASRLKSLESVDPGALAEALAHQVSAELASELGVAKSALQAKEDHQRALEEQLRDRDARVLQTQKAAEAALMSQQLELQRAGEQQAVLQAQVASQLSGAHLHVQHVEASAKELQLRAEGEVHQAQQAQIRATTTAETQISCAAERERRACAERDEARAATTKADAAAADQLAVAARLRDEAQATASHLQNLRSQEREKAKTQVDALRQAQQALQSKDQESVALHLALQQQREETEQLRRELSERQAKPSIATGLAPTRGIRSSGGASTGLHEDCCAASAPKGMVPDSRLSGRLSHGSSDHPLDSVISPISIASSRPVEVDLLTAEDAGGHDTLAKEILAASEGYRAQSRALDEALGSALDAAGGPPDGFSRPPVTPRNPPPLRGTRAELETFLTNRKSGQHAKSTEKNAEDLYAEFLDYARRPAPQIGWTTDEQQLWPEAEDDEDYDEYEEDESEDDRDPAMIPTPTSVRSTTSRATFCDPCDVDGGQATPQDERASSSSAPIVKEDLSWAEQLVRPRKPVEAPGWSPPLDAFGGRHRPPIEVVPQPQLPMDPELGRQLNLNRFVSKLVIDRLRKPSGSPTTPAPTGAAMVAERKADPLQARPCPQAFQEDLHRSEEAVLMEASVEKPGFAKSGEVQGRTPRLMKELEEARRARQETEWQHQEILAQIEVEQTRQEQVARQSQLAE